MAIDLAYSAEIAALVERTRAFTREVVMPIEDRHGGDIVRKDLQAAARHTGIFAPHAPVEYGGLGLSMSDRAPVFEEAGYSLSVRWR